jgi:hypothetical protein
VSIRIPLALRRSLLARPAQEMVEKSLRILLGHPGQAMLEQRHHMRSNQPEGSPTMALRWRACSSLKRSFFTLKLRSQPLRRFISLR